MRSRLAAIAATTLVLSACNDAPTVARGGSSPTAVALDPAAGANVVWEPTSSVRWNRKAISLFRARDRVRRGTRIVEQRAKRHRESGRDFFEDDRGRAAFAALDQRQHRSTHA